MQDTIVSKSNVLVKLIKKKKKKKKKNVLSHAMLPRESWDFDDLNQSAHPCSSAKMKIQARLRTGYGKSTTANFKKTNVVGEKASRSADD